MPRAPTQTKQEKPNQNEKPNFLDNGLVQTDLIGRERGIRLQATTIVGAHVKQNNVDSSSGRKKVGDEVASNNVMAGGLGGADAVIAKIADEKASKGGDGARFKKTPEVRAVCEAKEVLLHMLLHIFDLRLSARSIPQILKPKT
jgi:hypothetical protein